LGALGFDVDAVQRSARGDEQAVLLRAAETEVGTRFWQVNPAKEVAVFKGPKLKSLTACWRSIRREHVFDLAACRAMRWKRL
jgi:hypothetical protein